MEVEQIKKSLLKWRLHHPYLWCLHQRPAHGNIITVGPPRHFSQNKVCAKWSSRSTSATLQYHGISHLPPLTPPYPVFTSLFSCLKRLLCSVYCSLVEACCATGTDRTTEPRLPCRYCFLFVCLFVLFLTCEGDLELRSPVGSDDLCAVLCPLCGLLICVCVCVSVFLLSINVRT